MEKPNGEPLNGPDKSEADCKCLKIVGHLEDVNWLLWARKYQASPGALALGDWVKHPYIWLHHVESNDGELAKDDVLRSTDTRYWSIHDVQRYFLAEFHCEGVLFTCQYPNLRMSTRLGSHYWRSNAALKKPTPEYNRQLYRSISTTMMKIEAQQTQMDRLLISDQFIHLERMDYFRRKSFMRILLNILSFQERLQLVSLENLLCSRLEGVRLVQQLACFNAATLKYLFLWRFVLPNENPILVNYSYITDEEKSRLSKLLSSLEVQDVRLSERCSELVDEFHKQFDAQVEGEERVDGEEVFLNPYVVDEETLRATDTKLREFLAARKSSRKELQVIEILSAADPKRPWRTNSCKERLLRIENQILRHHETASERIEPLSEERMRDLVKECSEASDQPVTMTVSDVVEAARKNLPNFQYRRIENSTATAILQDAHIMNVEDEQQPSVTETVARSLGETERAEVA